MKRRHLALLLASLPPALLAGLGVPACDPGSTTGSPVTHAARVEAADDLAAPLENAKGWRVTVAHAYVSLASLRVFDGAPVTARAPAAPPAWRWALERLSTPSALAHPGHYTPGDALAEVLTPTSVDLVGGPLALGPADGFTGPYRSARLSFGAAPVGPAAGALGGDVVRLEGTATKGADSLSFVATASAADVLNTEEPPVPVVEGCAFAPEAVVTAPGTIVLRVAPSVWVDQIDFAATTPPASPGEVVALDGLARKAFVRGVVKGAAYPLAFEPGATP